MGKARRGWSAGGAARSARDYRIATVRYLRSAGMAREWHLAKLYTVYQGSVCPPG